MNWGYKILLVIIIFICAVLGMVYTAMRQTNEMEDANYYEKELQYQSKIDAANNLRSANADALLVQTAELVTLQLPAKLSKSFKQGTLEFLRLDDQKKDFQTAFVPDTAGTYSMVKEKFSYGMYKARISWEDNHTRYYKETSLFIEP